MPDLTLLATGLVLAASGDAPQSEAALAAELAAAVPNAAYRALVEDGHWQLARGLSDDHCNPRDEACEG